MRITWVLSDEERNRRFNKLKNPKYKVMKSNSKKQGQLLERPYVLHLPFSVEEQNIITDLKSKFHVPWLKNFLVLDRMAGINFIEYAFGLTDLKFTHWETFQHAMRLNFMNYVLPRFPELVDLSSHDIGQIMNSPAGGIAHSFRCCNMFNVGSPLEGKAEHCPIASYVDSMSRNQELVTYLDLSSTLSKLDLSKKVTKTRMPTYNELYRDGWQGDIKAEETHRDTVYKIVAWPTDDENRFDPMMVGLMVLILTFNSDFYTLDRMDKVEKIQVKYITILQRYLRSKMKPASANTKFLEAMLLIAQARHIWEISCGGKRMV